MRVSRLKTSLLFSLFLLTLFSISITARADDDEPDEYDEKARVARISLMTGEVNLKRTGNEDWEPARLNFPLVEGDTIATAANSRLEIQIDTRNFVRLSADSVLRVITLRDEGVALSVLEGTAVVRLAKFDRSRGYFEIDAPRTTMAAEKTGLYRIDVPREGRVRLTVRDGGSARIYSDTSGFALRDGRSAELVVTGDNAGDWELLVAAARDEIDGWVDQREQYLAQRLKYDVQYYDEYVWGAEDLDSYGDWAFTNDFGWIWRPRASSISAYNDWAPYRYGHWTWCPPYGWTWVGYEPWGWAPYHYGRWVYHNNYWAWCPRSQYYRTRSWWRPALVAFVFDISFGDNVCWYPLSYYQRDPHSRHYRHGDRDRGPGYGGHDDRRPYDNRTWRGVTRVPRRDFGNGDRRGTPVDERLARRVIDRDPQRGNFPRPGRLPGDIPGRVADRDPNAGGSARRRPVFDDRPTGAADRTPGVPLDEDLRRSRVFRGRDPRPADPTQTTTPTAGTETQPTGAVSRPGSGTRPGRGGQRQDPPASSDPPRADDPGRMSRPTIPEGEKRSRGRQQIEEPPRSAPEPRTEQTTPVTAPAAPPPEQPRVDRREREMPVARPESPAESRPEPQPESRPRMEPRSEPREPRAQPRESQPEPRSEAPRNDPPRVETPRSEPPRSEPRSEPRESRPEPRSEPRNESPRSEPRSEPRESRPEPRSEPSRSESPRSEPPRSEPPRSEAPRSEPPHSEPPRSESPRAAPARPSAPDRPRPDRPEL